MLFLAAESTKEGGLTHAAPLMFSKNLFKPAIMLLILNPNFRNLVVRDSNEHTVTARAPPGFSMHVQ